MTPPRAGLVPNIHRKSNPFASDEEADWVPASRPVGKQREIRVNDGVSQRPALPPRRGTSESSTYGSSSAQGNVGRSGVHRTGSANRLPVRASRDQKTPPPIPRKPTSLSSKENAYNVPSTKPLDRSATIPSIQSMDYGKIGSSLPIRGNSRASPKDTESTGSQTGKESHPHEDLLTGPTQNDNANSVGDLLDHGGEEVKWKSLLP